MMERNSSNYLLEKILKPVNHPSQVTWPVDSKFFEEYQSCVDLYIYGYVNGYSSPSTYDRQPIIICQSGLVTYRMWGRDSLH